MELRHAIGYLASKDLTIDGVDAEHVFICSSDVIDRSGEIIDQAGWMLDDFRANPVMLACHLHRLSDGRPPVIGSWGFMDVRKNVATAKGTLPAALVGGANFARDTELGKEYGSLYDARHMRAVSVGFYSHSGERRKINGKSVYVHTRCELIEVSAVAVGCNQEALSQLRQLGLADDKAADVIEQISALKGEFETLRSDVLAVLRDGLAEISEQLTLAPEMAEGDASQHARAADGSSSSSGDERPRAKVLPEVKSLMERCGY
jgi:hypothetical protein